MKRIPKDDYYVARWARYVKEWIPGFPGPREIFEGDTLAAVLAGYIWDVSVGHAVDHQTYVKDMPMDLKCFRIRLPPPRTKDMPAYDRGSLSRVIDQFKTHLATKMFFGPANVTLLHDTRYDFGDAELKKLNDSFLQDLKKAEAGLKVPNYLPLKEISRSIQY